MSAPEHVDNHEYEEAGDSNGESSVNPQHPCAACGEPRSGHKGW